MRNLFNDAPIALSILRGPQHQFEFINNFSRQLIGNRNVDGLTVREAFPELQQQGFFELLDQVYRTGEAVQGAERRAQLTDPHTGEVHDLYINYAYVPLRGFDAEVSGILSLSVDVTAYVEARLAREREAEARTAILSHLHQGVIVTDPQGRIIFVNEEAARLHGCSSLK
ncbi:PAS domain-containing protein [Deinococcus malanensis]|uniref:PAS domain-containing protein n=1 Tax=Deinococcus malanensis TaxID=1706855 RepID=UPI003639E7CB